MNGGFFSRITFFTISILAEKSGVLGVVPGYLNNLSINRRRHDPMSYNLRAARRFSPLCFIPQLLRVIIMELGCSHQTIALAGLDAAGNRPCLVRNSIIKRSKSQGCSI